ncbi:MAG: DUF937 domain-containing protein [Candidatus Sericytochromatia bacterium]
MADLDDLINQIPIADIAERLGVDEGEVSSAVRTLVPTLVGGIQHNVAAEDIDSRQLESAVTQRGAGDLVDGGVSLDQVDEQAGRQEVARIFGGNDTSHVASALSNAGAGNSDLLQKLLPIITPIVLSYIAKRLQQGGAQPAPQSSGSQGGLGDILGSILGGGSPKSDNPMGDILGNVLGDKGASVGDILGGLIRGGR